MLNTQSAESIATVRRRTALRGALLLLILGLPMLCFPGAASGQEQGGAVHEVIRGDTLWDLAARYLSGGTRWGEIYDMNRSSIADPDLILPGQRLRLPSRTAVASAPVSETPPPEDAADRPPSPQEDPFAGPSLFDRTPERTVSLGGFEVEEQPDLPLVSRTDFDRAPFLAKKKELEPVATTTRVLVANPLRLRLPATIPLNSRVVLALHGLTVENGQELIAFKWKRRVGKYGHVVEPVALLTVHKQDADSAHARVSQVFAAYEVGDPVIHRLPYPEEVPVGLQAVEGGPTGRILAFANKQPLLGVTEIAFLNIGAEQGVGIGDEFVSFTRNVPESALASLDDGQAILRVVQVRPTMSTATIVRMRDVGTSERSPVRLVGQAVPASP